MFFFSSLPSLWFLLKIYLIVLNWKWLILTWYSSYSHTYALITTNVHLIFLTVTHSPSPNIPFAHLIFLILITHSSLDTTSCSPSAPNYSLALALVHLILPYMHLILCWYLSIAALYRRLFTITATPTNTPLYPIILPNIHQILPDTHLIHC